MRKLKSATFSPSHLKSRVNVIQFSFSSVSSCGKLTIDSPFKNGGLVQMLNLAGMVV
ncbi:MAG: hypothetical protein ACI9J3_003246, partial [Parvicellaceae bacterium]